jgi:hypothetical protein
MLYKPGFPIYLCGFAGFLILCWTILTIILPVPIVGDFLDEVPIVFFQDL